LDHALKSTIPAKRPHDVWTLDESELPIYVRAFNPATGAEQVVKPQIVLVMDHFSRTILSAHLVPAFGDIGDGLGQRNSAAAWTEDILGAVWSAAMPQVAPPATQSFAGYLPRVLRMDNANTHRELRDDFTQLGIRVPSLPAYQPDARGDIERLFRTLKSVLPDVPGLTQHFFVADTATEHPRERRSRNVAVGRATNRQPIAIKDLLTIPQLRPHLDQLVFEYNNRPHRGLGRISPRQAYLSHLPARAELRAGTDLLSTAFWHAVTLQRGGLIVANQRFRTVDPVEMPAADTVCNLVMDPLRRGVWWMDCTPERFIPRVEDAALSPQILEGHIDFRALAGDASRVAAHARAVHLAEITGDPEAPERAEVTLRGTLTARKRAKSAESRRKRKLAKQAKEQGGEQSAGAKAGTATRTPQQGDNTEIVHPLAPSKLPSTPPLASVSAGRVSFPGFLVPKVS
jgi:hypothetical protein